MAVSYMNAAGRGSLQLGRGVDSDTGSPLGVAIVPDNPSVDQNNSGQIVSYDVSIVESAQELEDSLGLSVGAEMRYGMFSAEGKFEMREKSQYKSFATYVLAKCDVRNPPVGLFRPGAHSEAEALKNLPDNFKRAFGDGFVRSALTGGEFYVLMEIVNEDSNVQKSLAASLQAEYNGFLASAEVSFEVSTETKNKMSSSQIRILQYQAAGNGVNCGLVNNVAEVIGRLKAFPQIALDHPVLIKVEVAPYDTIPALQVNLVARMALREALDDCARKRAAYKQVVDELDFLLTGDNRSYFIEPPPDEEAQQWKRQYTTCVNQVTALAMSMNEGGEIKQYVEPEGMPVVRLKRLVPAPEVLELAVPEVKNMSLADAQQRLTQLGFIPIPRSRSVHKDDQTPRGIVLSQFPAPQTIAKKNSQVVIDYAVTESRFVKMLDQRQLLILRDTVRIAR